HGIAVTVDQEAAGGLDGRPPDLAARRLEMLVGEVFLALGHPDEAREVGVQDGGQSALRDSHGPVRYASRSAMATPSDPPNPRAAGDGRPTCRGAAGGSLSRKRQFFSEEDHPLISSPAPLGRKIARGAPSSGPPLPPARRGSPTSW